ncbi:DEAD/DEAH box helicase family protein [Yersinia enterocolitica]
MSNYLFKFISSDCGSGKTHQLINLMKKTTDNYIVVQGTKSLCAQTHEELDGLAKIITSNQYNNVYNSVIEFLLNPTHRVLIITDTTFLQIKDTTILKNWKIYLDDVVTFHQFRNVHTEQKELVEEHLFHSYEAIGDNHVTALPITDFDDEVIRGAASVFKFVNRYDHFLFNAGFFEKVGATNEYKRNKDQLQVMAWVNLDRFAGLDITFMANDFENTLVYLASPDSFVQTTLPLRERAVPLNERMKVFYFSEVPLTASFRENSPEQFEKVLQWVDENLNEYIYTVNIAVNDKMKSGLIPNMSKGSYVAPQSRGSNAFMNFNKAVWLASMKPSPVEAKQCELMFNLSFSQLLQAREKEELYQFIQRSNLRDYDSDEVVEVYVFDKDQALSLSSTPVFIDLKIERTNSNKSPSTFTALNMSEKEKSAFKRVKTFATKEAFDKWMSKPAQAAMKDALKEHFTNKWISLQ